MTRLRSVAIVARLWVGVLLWLGFTQQSVRADDAATALYVRTDTDHTTVVSPRVRAGVQLGEATRVDATYAADVWTSASIDIRTSASVRPVTEQRDEMDLALNQDLGDLKLRAGYRFSIEHDYVSHGVTLGGAYSFADNAATLDLNLRAIADTVGRAGDPQLSRAASAPSTEVSASRRCSTPRCLRR